MTPDTELDRKRLPRSVRLIISFRLVSEGQARPGYEIRGRR